MTDAAIPSLRQLFELVRDSGDEDVRISIEAKSCPDPAVGGEYEKSPDINAVVSAYMDLVKEFGFEDRVTL